MQSRFLIFYICLLLLSASCSKKSDSDTSSAVSETHQTANSLQEPAFVRIKVNDVGAHVDVFNDSNNMHLEAAKRLGIDPVNDLHGTYFLKRPIVKIESNQYYAVDTLHHSEPFLVPEAALLLTEIGRNFIDSLHSRGGRDYKVKVTSLLRTPESVARLRKVNVNAAEESAHEYGTTFDISYISFVGSDSSYSIDQGDLKNLLAEVLNDLRKEDKCFVKFERKTGCFHITPKK